MTFPRTVCLIPGTTTLSSRREGSDRIGWPGSIERILSPSAGLKNYGCAGSGDFSLSLSSIHTLPRVSCSSGTLSKLKYVHTLLSKTPEGCTSRVVRISQYYICWIAYAVHISDLLLKSRFSLTFAANRYFKVFVLRSEVMCACAKHDLVITIVLCTYRYERIARILDYREIMQGRNFI